MEKRDIIQIAVLLCGSLLVVLNYTLLAPALPVIMQQMQVTATQVQWVTSVYALVEAVVIPLNAFFLGRFSTRRLFVGAFALFIAGSALAAWAPTFALLLVARVLQACATGVVMPMVFTLVLLMAPIERRGYVMGIVGVVMSFAPAIGPPVAGVLVDAVGWRALFVIVAVTSVGVALLGTFLLKNRAGFERTSFDVPSIVLSSLGMLGLLYGLSTCTSTDMPAVSVLLMAAGVALLALFTRRQGSLEVPMLRVDILRKRRFRNAMVVVVLLEAALIAVDVLLPLFMQNALGATPTQTGLAMAPAALAGAVGGVVAGRWFDGHGVRGIALVGACLLEAAAIGLCLCGMDASLVVIAGIYMVETIGWQFISTPTNTWGINSLPNQIIQHGNAVMSTLMQVGASFGTAAIVSLTALGLLVAPLASGEALAYAGCHVAFIGCAALLGAVALVAVFGIRDGR